MKLKVLADNNTIIDRYYLGEPGLSFLLETGGSKILFDMGYSDVFIRNAFKMGESLRDIGQVVFSHGHVDHTWGLDPYIRLMSEWAGEGLSFARPVLTAHDEIFLSRRYGDLREIGSLVSREKTARHFDLRLTREPLELAENLWYLGQIERRHAFEGTLTIGEVFRNGAWEPDQMIDDTALAYKSPEGLVVVTGCSHAGICNIIDQAVAVTGEDRVLDVIGGFHLMEPDSPQVERTGRYFKEKGIESIHPCHCTCLGAKIELARHVGVKPVGAGLILTY